ncbi:hypothetical protein GCM10009819_07450 [Agromyces tropicus]|uniref:EthD domain-containing protein n=1 Tax=Agromyces tropicus TaxID=555371 RepID=A0ABN2U2W5_9MICO
MYTIAFFTRRVPGMSREQFFDHYRGTHYDLAVRMPGLVSYQQSELAHGDERWPPSAPFEPFDALSLYTFESREAAVAAFTSAEGLEVDADTPGFMEWSSILSAPAEVIRRFDADTG